MTNTKQSSTLTVAERNSRMAHPGKGVRGAKAARVAPDLSRIRLPYPHAGLGSLPVAIFKRVVAILIVGAAAPTTGLLIVDGQSKNCTPAGWVDFVLGLSCIMLGMGALVWAWVVKEEQAKNRRAVRAMMRMTPTAREAAFRCSGW